MYSEGDKEEVVRVEEEDAVHVFMLWVRMLAWYVGNQIESASSAG